VSAARPIFENISLMLTRRVRQRVFLLRPSKRVNQIVSYVVAVKAKRWNIHLHGICVLSNHWHVCLTDPDGNIVGFQRDCHTFIARALNGSHSDFESVWASGQQSSRVECEMPSDLIAKIAYTMANPTESALVRNGHSWPGLRRSWPSEPRVIPKPARFFRGADAGGVWPDEATLEFVRPPGYEQLSDDELGAVVRGAIARREETFRNIHDANGRKFLGRAAILRQSRYHSPQTYEPRFGISPKVACEDKWRRIERLRANKLWGIAYKAALATWRFGVRDVVFPAGTYRMRVLHGVTCAAAPG
jgi:hypothetical protein